MPQARLGLADASVYTSMWAFFCCSVSRMGNQPWNCCRNNDHSKRSLVCYLCQLHGSFGMSYKLQIKGWPIGKALDMKLSFPTSDWQVPVVVPLDPSILVICCRMSHCLSWGTLTIISKVSINNPKNSITWVANTLLFSDMGTLTSAQVSWIVCIIMSHTCYRICAVKKSSRYLEIGCLALFCAIHCSKSPTFLKIAHEIEALKVKQMSTKYLLLKHMPSKCQSSGAMGIILNADSMLPLDM